MKKSSNTWNIRYQWLGGALIVYVLFRFLKKKNQSIPTPTTGSSLLGLSTGTSLSFDEIYSLIRREEGFNPVAVKDGKDRNGNQLYTIGIGHQIQPNESFFMSATLTEEQAKNLWQKDIVKIVEDMQKNIQVPINKNQQLALISLRYNIGGPQFNSSSLLRVLNQKDYLGASQKFKDWRLSEGKINPGLVARRERERVLFLKP